MSMESVIQELDRQIARFQEAKQLLLSDQRPFPATAVVRAETQRHYRISAESRKKMADAQRKRWAAKKGAAKSA